MSFAFEVFASNAWGAGVSYSISNSVAFSFIVTSFISCVSVISEVSVTSTALPVILLNNFLKKEAITDFSLSSSISADIFPEMTSAEITFAVILTFSSGIFSFFVSACFCSLFIVLCCSEFIDEVELIISSFVIFGCSLTNVLFCSVCVIVLTEFGVSFISFVVSFKT